MGTGTSLPVGARRRPTLVEVAQLAGVSIATVSRVLNGTTPVSPPARCTWGLTDAWYDEQVGNPDPALLSRFVIDTSRNGQGRCIPRLGSTPAIRSTGAIRAGAGSASGPRRRPGRPSPTPCSG